MRTTFLTIAALFGLSLAPAITAGQTQADFQRVAGLFRLDYNSELADSLFGLFSPEVKKLVPPDRARQLLITLHAQLGLLNTLQLTRQGKDVALYKAAFERSVVTLQLALDPGARISGFHFLPYQTDSGSSKTGEEGESVSLKTATGVLTGSLLMPPDRKKVPLVLIIAGSGPTDRDGNAPTMGLRSDMYLLLADSLASHGIASFRYDKRGIGASAAAMTSEADLTFDDYIADAAAWIALLRKDQRFSRIIVLGHSEGSLIGMVAAREAKADAFISASGAGNRIDKDLLAQIAAQSPVTADSARVLLDSLAEGLRVHVSSGPLLAYFRPSIQPYMISWLKHDPRKEIGRLTIPVLILQGTTDLQVTVSDAEKLKAAKPDATLKLIKGMNHIFRLAGTDRQENFSTYTQPSLPLVPEAVADIVSFVSTLH